MKFRTLSRGLCLLLVSGLLLLLLGGSLPSVVASVSSGGVLKKNSSSDVVVVLPLNDFPRDVVALHFPCAESNMFATNCACHLRCRDRGCKDAVQLCERYHSSRGCKYVLLRGGANNRIATLKRIPTSAESAQYDLSGFSRSTTFQLKPGGADSRVGDLVRAAGAAGEQLVDRLANYNQAAYGRLKLCPGAGSFLSRQARNSSWRNSFLASSISLVAVSYQAPKTLLNSVRSWNSSGLLSMTAENIIILNDPLPEDVGIAAAFGLRVLQPRDIPNAKRSKPNVLTLGAAFYYALRESRSEYVLFLENDFKMDTALSQDEIRLELVAAVGLLERGAEIVRLLSRKHQGCGTFKSCDHGGINLQTDNMMDRRRNWFAFYCHNHPGSEKHVSTCLEQPEYRCFTSWDSNWSLNAVLVKRSSMLGTKYPTGTRRGKDQEGSGGDGRHELKSIADIGLEQYVANDGFESTMSWGVKWMRWHVPMCISYSGLFLHEEIETSA